MSFMSMITICPWNNGQNGIVEIERHRIVSWILFVIIAMSIIEKSRYVLRVMTVFSKI